MAELCLREKSAKKRQLRNAVKVVLKPVKDAAKEGFNTGKRNKDANLKPC
jgi:hypothetical protein